MDYDERKTMIDTLNSKPPHYTHGSFSVGTGKDVILIVGSCRVVPYANYFDYLNTGNRWTIHLINVVNFHFDAQDRRVEADKVLARFETNPHLLNTIKTAKWYIHEHTANFGMLNSDRNCAKHIYQFGMKPEVDIALPNWNCVNMHFQEMVRFDEGWRLRAKTDLQKTGKLSKELCDEIRGKGLEAFEKFLGLCERTDLPQMAGLMRENWQREPYFWSGSHVSAAFTMAVMQLMNEHFLDLDIPEAFWRRVEKEDLYSNTAIPITRYDVEAYGWKWNVPIRPLVV